MKFAISILKYLGKLDKGILVLLSVVYKEKYYEATFYYTDADIFLTISEELTEELGHEINQDPEYIDILKDILHKITPYKEIITQLEDII